MRRFEWVPRLCRRNRHPEPQFRAADFLLLQVRSEERSQRQLDGHRPDAKVLVAGIYGPNKHRRG